MSPRRKLAVSLSVVALVVLALGAAGVAQVTREEFDVLSARVDDLQQRTAAQEVVTGRLQESLLALEARIRRMPGDQPPAEPPVPPEDDDVERIALTDIRPGSSADVSALVGKRIFGYTEVANVVPEADAPAPFAVVALGPYDAETHLAYRQKWGDGYYGYVACVFYCQEDRALQLSPGDQLTVAGVVSEARVLAQPGTVPRMWAVNKQPSCRVLVLTLRDAEAW
jgi:hypothetical protein